MSKIYVAFAALSVCLISSGCVVSSATHDKVLMQLDNTKEQVGELTTTIGEMTTDLEKAKTQIEELEASEVLLKEQADSFGAKNSGLTIELREATEEVQDSKKKLLETEGLLAAAERQATADKKKITLADAQAAQAESNATKANADLRTLGAENAKLNDRIEELISEKKEADANADKEGPEERDATE